MAPQVGLEPTTLRLTAECSAIELLRHLGGCTTLLESGGDLLSRAVSSQVPSALKGLTSVFGMGTGGTPSPLPPEIVSILRARLSNACPTRYTLSSESPLRASRVYTLFHPVPLANLHNCTPSLSFSLHLDLSLNEAFDLLVAATSARYRASSAALSTC